MNVDSIKNGIVIDHIKAGKSMEIYEFLNLGELKSSVAIIKNVTSRHMGKKDIIKIDESIDVNLDALGYIDHNITINIIKDGVIVKKSHLELPQTITNIAKCKNPRCITSVEQDIQHIFKLCDKEKGIYRCIYCESRAKEEE